MAQSLYVLEKSFKAATDLSGNQYYFVKQTGDGEVNLCNTLGEFSYGVLQNKPESGKAANVRLEGTSKVVASGAIARDSYVTTNASGKAVATTTAGHFVRGIALQSASADGDIIEIWLTGFKY